MIKAREISFIKMDGLGNDFVLIDARAKKIKLSAKDICALGDRRTGVGFDQLFVLEKSKCADVKMNIYNSDGSKAGACGNGARCVGKFLFEDFARAKNGRAAPKTATIEAPYGKILQVQKAAGGLFSVNMGKAVFEAQKIPLAGGFDALNMPKLLKCFDAPTAVSMGNPHAVFFVKDVQDVCVGKLGPSVENNTKVFPDRTNVEFAQVISPSKILMQVWERGAGITRACGSGACATLAAAFKRGLTSNKAQIVMTGGTLVIEQKSNGDIYMTGPAHTSFYGIAYL